jgi:2-polyprenyl-3-methyl-5-hydroxy-6-metoxy-1,4-benzoquinol methylase
MSDPASKGTSQAYNHIADSFDQQARDNLYNTRYERPATLSLLPDVRGKRVLDAGCGPGHYAEWLLEHGARVTAIDAAERFVQLARQRLGERAHVRQADLSQPLDFLADDSFEVIVSALVLDHIADLESVFREFYRLLGAGGVLVFSLTHPHNRIRKFPDMDYHQTALLLEEWTSYGVTVPTYRRPLSAITDALSAAGFRITNILEPRPTEDARRWPEDYAHLMRYPAFIVFRAEK